MRRGGFPRLVAAIGTGKLRHVGDLRADLSFRTLTGPWACRVTCQGSEL